MPDARVKDKSSRGILFTASGPAGLGRVNANPGGLFDRRWATYEVSSAGQS